MEEKKIVYEITNPQYIFDPNFYPPMEKGAYLIVGENKDGNALINHFGEEVAPHEKTIEHFEKYDLSVKRVFTNGNILELMGLKEKFDGQPIKDTVNNLEKELMI